MNYIHRAKKYLGKALRKAKVYAPAIPALAGIVMLSIGAGLIFLPAGCLVAGIMLMWLDYRL